MMRGLLLVLVMSVACAAPIDSNNKPVDASAGGFDGRRVYHDAPRTTGGDGGSGSGSAFVCVNQVTDGTNNQGHHNPGMDCMDSCHDHGFTIGGTLYTSSAGSTIVSGATITVIDAFGNRTDMVSQTNGNFYSSFAIEFPATIYVSECPTIQMMTAPVQAQSASLSQSGCNQTSCHASGGSQGRVHLP